MKTRLTLCTLAIIAAIFSISCTDKTTETEPLEAGGTFKIGGVTFKGKSSVQTFGNSNYSVVCEQDEPYKFIQITFHNQAEAEKGGTFEVADDVLKIASGTVNVGVDGQTFDPETPAKITVSGKSITIKNLKLVETGQAVKKVTIEEAKVAF